MARLIDLPELIVRDVAELPDRTSPPDAPDMMLVTASELDGIVSARVAEIADAIAQLRVEIDRVWAANKILAGAAKDENERLRAALAEIVSQCHNLPRAMTADRIEKLAQGALTSGDHGHE